MFYAELTKLSIQYSLLFRALQMVRINESSGKKGLI